MVYLGKLCRGNLIGRTGGIKGDIPIRRLGYKSLDKDYKSKCFKGPTNNANVKLSVPPTHTRPGIKFKKKILSWPNII